MYPEDYSINCVRLIRQWIAEGFVKEIKNKKLEEVAREYLNELIHRNLVQVSKVDFDGRVRICRLHDIFREIVLQKMEDLSFCHVLSREESSFEGRTRRLSMDGVSYNALEGYEDKHIHSLLLFNLDELPKSFMSTFFANFKLLKSLVSDIPVEIKKLRKLRHLIAYYRDNKLDFSLAWEKGVKIEKGIECLKYLQKLYHVELNHGGVDLIKELGKLRQLRKLVHFVSPSMSSTPLLKVLFREVAGMDSTTSTSSQNKNTLVKVE
ncbi:disease resistance protein RPM1-like [Fagus crenata]